MRIVLVCHNNDWHSLQHKAFIELRAGLRANGHQVKVCQPHADEIHDSEAIFAWNCGRREWWQKLRMQTMDRGALFFIMERGWFDRMEYTQIDHKGFNHTASWAKDIATQAPIGGVEAFRMLRGRLSPRMVAESKPRGYVLILGQCGNDTQLRQSEIHHADALCESVIANLPAGLNCVFRPHPLSKYRPPDIESLDGSLDDALAGARFVVTINSNAGNDALWAGIPVLCFGPALYEMAGVARRTSISTLMHDMEFMCKGWEPDDRRVLSYFHWLAARQWNTKELEQGDCLKQLLGDIDGQD